MEPEALRVGNTEITYVVRWSTKARRKRIIVTPDSVEVVVPTGTALDGEGGVRAYVQQKRRWLFDATRDVAERHRKLLTQRYASGAKLQYRGRWLMLEVTPADVDTVEIRCRSKFMVAVPRGLEGVEQLRQVGAAFDSWLRGRALKELHRFGRRHQDRLGVQAKGLRLSDAKARWGSLGKDEVVRVHWRLIQAPAAAMEYVVAHEVAHLIERNHSPEFWQALGRCLPDWKERKAMLERWEEEPRAV